MTLFEMKRGSKDAKFTDDEVNKLVQETIQNMSDEEFDDMKTGNDLKRVQEAAKERLSKSFLHLRDDKHHQAYCTDIF